MTEEELWDTPIEEWPATCLGSLIVALWECETEEDEDRAMDNWIALNNEKRRTGVAKLGPASILGRPSNPNGDEPSIYERRYI